MSKRILSEPDNDHFYSEEEFKKELETLPPFTIETAKYLIEKEIKPFLLIENDRLKLVQELFNSYYGITRTHDNSSLIKKLAKEFYAQNKSGIDDLCARKNYKLTKKKKGLFNRLK